MEGILMREFDYTVKSIVGLHPRVAGVLMHLVRDFESDIILTNGDKGGNLKKLLTYRFPGRMKKWRARKCRHLWRRTYDGQAAFHGSLPV